MESQKADNVLEMLDRALVALCSIQVSGPPVVPLGRAMEAVNGAILAMKEMKNPQEEQP